VFGASRRRSRTKAGRSYWSDAKVFAMLDSYVLAPTRLLLCMSLFTGAFTRNRFVERTSQAQTGQWVSIGRDRYGPTSRKRPARAGDSSCVAPLMGRPLLAGEARAPWREALLRRGSGFSSTKPTVLRGPFPDDAPEIRRERTLRSCFAIIDSFKGSEWPQIDAAKCNLRSVSPANAFHGHSASGPKENCGRACRSGCSQSTNIAGLPLPRPPFGRL